MKLIIEVNKGDLDFIRKTYTQDSHDYIPMVIRNNFVDAVLNGIPLDNVFDKIRAEIEFEVDHRTNMLCAEDVFEIIDKCKEQTE